jgi:peptide-methionine (S)-S-oxide reductase
MIATLGGGCFWCLEACYEQVGGVSQVISGYAGGATPNPDYKSVCSGRTGHAEVVQVMFDPAVITYRDILTIFFAIHDPTSLNKQGNDVGTQYRSVIYTHDAEQHATATALIEELDDAETWPMPIVTAVEPLPTFYPAEDYHQGYYRGNPQQPYCVGVVAPKVAKLRKTLTQFLK